MSYTPRDVLGNENKLTEKLVVEKSAPLQQQVAPAYNPEPYYPSKIRHDPQPDRSLPNLKGVNRVIKHTPVAGRQVNVDDKGNPVDYNSVNSGIEYLIDALTGVDSNKFVEPLPEKPLQQRNSLGNNNRGTHQFQGSGFKPHENASRPVRQRNKIGR